MILNFFKDIIIDIKEYLPIEYIKNNKVISTLLIISTILFHTFITQETHNFIGEILGFIGLFLGLCLFIMLMTTAHNGSYVRAVLMASIGVYAIYYFNGQNYPLIYLGEFIPIVIYGLLNWKHFKKNNM